MEVEKRSITLNGKSVEVNILSKSEQDLLLKGKSKKDNPNLVPKTITDALGRTKTIYVLKTEDSHVSKDTRVSSDTEWANRSALEKVASTLNAKDRKRDLYQSNNKDTKDEGSASELAKLNADHDSRVKTYNSDPSDKNLEKLNETEGMLGLPLTKKSAIYNKAFESLSDVLVRHKKEQTASNIDLANQSSIALRQYNDAVEAIEAKRKALLDRHLKEVSEFGGGK